MVLGMTLQTFTMVHVVISLIAIVTGLIVAWSMLNKTRNEGWIGVFLLATALTSITGFLFPVPLSPVLPSQIFGYISLAVLVPTVLGYYVYNLTGAWRWIYVGGALLVLYLNVFVLVVQAFQKVPFLRPLAPTQSELPFFVAQGVVFVLFCALTVIALRRFRPAPVEA
jgi:hypothetical protein